VAVDRHRARGLDLTPEERVNRRSNRRWMLGLAGSSIVILVAALVASGFAANNEPSGPRITAPAGYQTVNDSYFAYVVPNTWATNPAFSDLAGDVDTSGPTGWAGENIGFRRATPVMGETPPVPLQAFGVLRPGPFQLAGGHAIAVRGAAAAFLYTATRPGGFHATVIDAYDARNGVELWLMVDASPAVTDQVVSSLQS
jgi:hypothetical protein